MNIEKVIHVLKQIDKAYPGIDMIAGIPGTTKLSPHLVVKVGKHADHGYFFEWVGIDPEKLVEFLEESNAKGMDIKLPINDNLDFKNVQPKGPNIH